MAICSANASAISDVTNDFDAALDGVDAVLALTAVKVDLRLGDVYEGVPL